MSKGTCLVERCELVIYTRGICRNHYEQWRRGKPIPILPSSQPRGLPAIERLLAHREIVDQGYETPCWISSYAINPVTGYAVIWDGKGTPGAHVVSYEHYVGPVPKGKQVDHLCHPSDGSCVDVLCRHRRCWNPLHLHAKTAEENMARSMTPGAVAIRTGLCGRGHSMGDAYTDRKGHRTCRTCQLAYMAEKYAAEKSGTWVPYLERRRRAKAAKSPGEKNV